MSDLKVVVQKPLTQVLTLVTQGPQGPPGTVAELGMIPNVDTTGVVDKAVLYYDASTSTFLADATVTTSTLTDGGNY